MLRPQKNDFSDRDEYRNRRQHDRRDARRHGAFRPEKQAVIQDEDENRENGSRRPLAPRRRRRSPHSHPAIQHQPRNQEPQARQQKRRHFADTDPDRQKSRSPDEINRREREQNLPDWWPSGRVHNPPRLASRNRAPQRSPHKSQVLDYARG